MKKPHRSQKKLTYHGRSGYPIIHYTQSGKAYILVRKKGGGVKRLYLVHGDVPKKHQTKGGDHVGRKKKKSKRKKWGKIGAPHSAKRKRHLARIRKKR